MTAGPPRTVLVASTPIPAHTLNATAVVRSLKARGVRVVWYLDPSLHAHACRFLPREDVLSPDLETRGLGADRGVPRSPASIRCFYLDTVARPSAAHASRLRAIIDAYRVDLAVADTLMVGLGVAADASGVPWASIGDGPLAWPDPEIPPFGTGLPLLGGPAGRHRNRTVKRALDAALYRPALVHLNGIRAAHGLWPLSDLITAGVSRTAHLQGCTPSFEYPRRNLPDFIHFVGALGPGPGYAPPVPEALRRPHRTRPLAVVTQGTLRGDAGELILPAVRVLLSLGYCILVAGRTALKGHPNVVGMPAVDYTDAMRQADVLITNGGYTGVTLALAAGTPVVLFGATEEKPDIGARLRASGAGVAIRRLSPPERLLRRAVLDATSAGRRPTLQRLAAEFSALPTDSLIAEALLRGEAHGED